MKEQKQQKKMKKKKETKTAEDNEEDAIKVFALDKTLLSCYPQKDMKYEFSTIDFLIQKRI